LRLTDLLLESASDVHASGIADIHITGLTADSRQVQPGFLFAALPGSRADGRDFIAEAVRRGAVAVLAPPGTLRPLRPEEGAPSVTLLLDDNPRRRFALLAARFFQRQPETVAAVTGTNGKTSVAWFLQQIWDALGFEAASLGTLGLFSRQIRQPGSLTTPDPATLHETLTRLADVGVGHLAMEASSHGLDQYRLDGVRIAAAAFTNLTRDHLDYHGSMSTYRAAKLRLFGELVATGGAAVICADDPHAPDFEAAAAERGLRVLSYGRAGRELYLQGLTPTPQGQRLDLSVLGRPYRVELPLAGDFQAANALAAAGLAIGTGSAPDAVLAALQSLQPVRGRLERVALVRGQAPVYVDYAHTPDALEVVLRALRPQVRGRLSVVFGCGGDRDAGKRPEMGRIAASLADRVIVTDDNPRSEDAAAIRRQILAACPGAEEIGDRAQAITAAVAALDSGDVLLVAGKGHEAGQIVGRAVLPFDDADAVRAAVREVGE